MTSNILTIHSIEKSVKFSFIEVKYMTIYPIITTHKKQGGGTFYLGYMNVYLVLKFKFKTFVEYTGFWVYINVTVG